MTRSAHSASPIYPYPEFAPMVTPMPMPPQPYMPMMPEPTQCFPPSPMMHCSMYDGPGWNMMPMYPIPPIQPLHDNAGEFPPSYFHPRKPWGIRPPSSSSPVPDLTQRAVYFQNLHPATTTADLKVLLQGAGIVEQCSIMVTPDVHNALVHNNASAIMHSVEEAKRAVIMFNRMMFMGSRIRVKMDHSSDMARSGSWDEIATRNEPYLTEDIVSEKRTECSSFGQDSPLREIKRVSPNEPFVVDGSGLQKKSLQVLSTSAPT